MLSRIDSHANWRPENLLGYVPLLVAAALLGCGTPVPDEQVGQPDPAEHGGDEHAGAHGDDHAGAHGEHSMMADDADLTPLAAPLQVTHEEGATPKAVELLAGEGGSTLVITSAMKGYIEPCGCTLDVLLGGIDRVSGFTRSMAGLAPTGVVDAGNLLFEELTLAEGAIPQAMRKARLMLQGHRAMGTASTTPGPYDFSLGVETYVNFMKETGVPVTVGNLSHGGRALGEPWRIVAAGDLSVAVIGVTDPASVADVPDLVASDPRAALDGALAAIDPSAADLVVVIAQGERAFAQELVADMKGIDFVVVGAEPSKSDEVVNVGESKLIEAYSQGRHVGVLRLFPTEVAAETWDNARPASAEELDRLERRIAYIDSALDRVPPARSKDEREFIAAKRQELTDLKRERLVASSATVERDPSRSQFAWFSVAMEPGYPLDVALFERKARYTEGLESLYAELALTVPEPGPGEASYVGGEACVDCHDEAHDVWMGTPHLLGLKTLEEKGKHFDPDCVRCHVTGYGEPGGSIVGNVGPLAGIQCESCHGPGSIHVETPEGDIPGQIRLEAGADVCLACHDPENSPRFDYDNYLPLILGEGHEAK